jgi:hypothetical protein
MDYSIQRHRSILLKDVGSDGLALCDKLPQAMLFFDMANECIDSQFAILFDIDLKPARPGLKPLIWCIEEARLKAYLPYAQ